MRAVSVFKDARHYLFLVVRFSGFIRGFYNPSSHPHLQVPSLLHATAANHDPAPFLGRDVGRKDGVPQHVLPRSLHYDYLFANIQIF